MESFGAVIPKCPQSDDRLCTLTFVRSGCFGVQGGTLVRRSNDLERVISAGSAAPVQVWGVGTLARINASVSEALNQTFLNVRVTVRNGEQRAARQIKYRSWRRSRFVTSSLGTPSWLVS